MYFRKLKNPKIIKNNPHILFLIILPNTFLKTKKKKTEILLDLVYDLLEDRTKKFYWIKIPMKIEKHLWD